MITLKDLYTGGVAPGISQGMQWAGQKQSIDNAKTRNQLAELALQNEPTRIANQNRLADLRIQDTQQSVDQGRQSAAVTNLDLLRRALEGQGPISEIQDDDTANQRYRVAQGLLGQAGVDLTGMPETVTAQELQAVGGMGGVPDDKGRVGAQQILEDGTIIQSTNEGPKVWSAGGQLLTGQAASDAIRKARSYQVKNQQDIYGARRAGTLGADISMGGAAEGSKAAGKQAIEKSGEAFDQLANIDSNMSNLDEAVRLIDEGAQTGLVVGRLPSVSKASRELDNLQARLGLDVIGNTTFGALSESELNFALNTALPKDLPPAELREWLIRKKEAQGKLRDYLQQAAIFLGTPGNTVADWAQIQQEQQPAESGDVESLLEKYR